MTSQFFFSSPDPKSDFPPCKSTNSEGTLQVLST